MEQTRLSVDASISNKLLGPHVLEYQRMLLQAQKNTTSAIPNRTLGHCRLSDATLKHITLWFQSSTMVWISDWLGPRISSELACTVSNWWETRGPNLMIKGSCVSQTYILVMPLSLAVSGSYFVTLTLISLNMIICALQGLVWEVCDKYVKRPNSGSERLSLLSTFAWHQMEALEWRVTRLCASY